MLSSVPDIYDKKLETQDKFIILASDGVWDVISPARAVRYVWDYYTTGRFDPKSAESAADYIRRKALIRWNNTGKTADNISIAIVFLNQPQELTSLEEGPPPPKKHRNTPPV